MDRTVHSSSSLVRRSPTSVNSTRMTDSVSDMTDTDVTDNVTDMTDSVTTSVRLSRVIQKLQTFNQTKGTN